VVRPNLESQDTERGVTLVELLVYSVLLMGVLAIAGSILLSAATSQRDVAAMANASDQGQVGVRLFERSMRNAASVAIPSTHGGDLLIVKTRVGQDGTLAASWVCRAWHYDATSRQLRTISGPATGTPVTRNLTAPLNSSTWRVVLSGVSRTPDGASVKPVFSAQGASGATMDFDLKIGTSASRLTFASAAIPRPQGSTIGGVSCT